MGWVISTIVLALAGGLCALDSVITDSVLAQMDSEKKYRYDTVNELMKALEEIENKKDK